LITVFDFDQNVVVRQRNVIISQDAPGPTHLELVDIVTEKNIDEVRLYTINEIFQNVLELFE